MAILSKAWNNFKTQPDAWFFYGFLLTFALSVRKVLFFYPINGNFNEYTGIYLYLSDILLILTILVWIVTILRNKKLNLSSCITFFSRQEIFVLPLVLLIWSFLSISWSGNTNLALFKSLKLAELTLLFAYVSYNALNKPFLLNTVGFIVALGFMQAIIGIAQAVLQHSVGLFWLKESLISLNIDGVAKVVLFGHKFVRTYGLFPHPNILGGFLLISIVLTLVYKRIFHLGRNENVSPQKKCSTPAGMFHVEHPAGQAWNILRGKRGTFSSYGASIKHFIFPWSGTMLYIILVIQIIALLLTFSKSAVLGLFIVICYLGYKMFHPSRIVPRGTSYGASVKHLCRYLVTIIIMFALLLTIFGFNVNSLLIKSLEERLLYLNVSRETIVNNPMVGVGMGQFVEDMQKYSSVFLANWQYQPVHNVFLLIWSELGIIGLVLFILFLWKVFKSNGMFHSSRNVPRGTSYEASVKHFNVSWGETATFKGILFGFIIIMLFDHYLWDIQQGQVMLWIMLGLAAGARSSGKHG